MSLIKKVVANKKKRLKKTIKCSVKKKVAAEVKKIAVAANRVINKVVKAAKAAEEVTIKKNPKNNRKDKKAGHL